MVGHREIVVSDDAASGALPVSRATRACSLGGDVVPRAEFSRVAAELDYMTMDRDAWKARAFTAESYAKRAAERLIAARNGEHEDLP